MVTIFWELWQCMWKFGNRMTMNHTLCSILPYSCKQTYSLWIYWISNTNFNTFVQFCEYGHIQCAMYRGIMTLNINQYQNLFLVHFNASSQGGKKCQYSLLNRKQVLVLSHWHKEVLLLTPWQLAKMKISLVFIYMCVCVCKWIVVSLW